MVLILAALSEEVRLALDLASRRQRIRAPGCSLWALHRKAECYHLLKTGAGPARSAAALQRALAAIQPGFLLNIGYAGALDPTLRAGDLVIATRAFEAGTEFPLSSKIVEHLREVAAQAGLAARTGALLTVDRIIGDGAEKRLLAGSADALAVDMETAALARVAAAEGIPFGCVRVVADEAEDRIASAAWHHRLAAARRLLGAYLKAYLEELAARNHR